MTETNQGSFVFSVGTNINSRYMFKWMSKYVFGTEAENTVSGQCFSFLFSLFLPCLLSMAFPFSPFLVPWIKILPIFQLKIDGREFSDKFFFFTFSQEMRVEQGMRGYVISGKCLKLQIKPVSTICRNIRPARVLFPPNSFSHPQLESIAFRL